MRIICMDALCGERALFGAQYYGNNSGTAGFSESNGPYPTDYCIQIKRHQGSLNIKHQSWFHAETEG